jgi:hypothetical protein
LACLAAFSRQNTSDGVASTGLLQCKWKVFHHECPQVGCLVLPVAHAQETHTLHTLVWKFLESYYYYYYY